MFATALCIPDDIRTATASACTARAAGTAPSALTAYTTAATGASGAAGAAAQFSGRNGNISRPVHIAPGGYGQGPVTGY